MDNHQRRAELELLLALARDHDTCSSEKARIDGDSVVIPFDCLEPYRGQADQWTIKRERVHNRRELLEALGY